MVEIAYFLLGLVVGVVITMVSVVLSLDRYKRRKKNGNKRNA